MDAGASTWPPPSPSPSPLSTIDPDRSSDLFAVPSIPARSIKRPSDAGSDSPSKRSRQSQSSTGFGATTKSRLTKLYSDRCWHCRAMLPEMAHVFAKGDDAFGQCKLLGLIGLDHINHTDNALYLCLLCHAAYDRTRPLLLVAPADLDFFINWEKAWQSAFAVAPTARPPVSPAEYAEHCNSHASSIQHSSDGSTLPFGGSYICYMSEYFLATLDEPPLQPSPCRTRSWHGDPMAIIWRAKKAIHGHPDLQGPLLDLKWKLVVLDSLYDRGNAMQREYTAKVPPLPPLDPDSDRDPGSGVGHQTHPSPSSDQHRRPPETSGEGYGETRKGPPPHSSFNSSSQQTRHLGASFSASLTSNAANRKRSRNSSDAEVTAVLANTPRKRGRPANASLEKMVPASRTEQAERLWRWGGPRASTAKTVEYWNNLVKASSGRR